MCMHLKLNQIQICGNAATAMSCHVLKAILDSDHQVPPCVTSYYYYQS